MRLRHFLIVILAFALFLILGCSKTVEQEIEGNNNEFPPSMTGLILINGVDYQMEEGNYQWKRKKWFNTEVIQTDHLSPFQMAAQIKSISVNPNHKIKIMIEENPRMKVYIWNEKGRAEEIELDKNEIIVPSSKGQYIYEVLAEWNQGEISYTFVIDII